MANVIGQRVRRKEDPRFLKGEGRYVDNMPPGDALHLTYVRSPVAHARITGIDVSEARALPGVQVFTADDVDLDKNPLPPFLGVDERMHRPFLAKDTVRFAGDIVACVLTDSRAAGADAAELIYVDYEDLPVITDPREAVKDETLLFPDMGTHPCIKPPPGKVEAYRISLLADAGAYPGLGAFLPNLTGMMASGVYKIPKIGIDVTAVTTNTTTIGPFRGAGRPEATQAIERAMDMWAAELGMDPAEARRVNFIQPDDFPFTTASGATYDIGDYEGALDTALGAAGYKDLRAEQERRRSDGALKQLGIGLSVYVEIT